MDAPYTKPDGTTVIIARAPRKVIVEYLVRHGYRWEPRWEAWTNGKDEDLRFGSTIYGHYLYTA